MSTVESLDFFRRHPDVVRSVRTHSFASLAFQVWDTALTFGDEVEYVWSIPWSYQIKWWYLYFRYVTLAAHIMYDFSVSYLTSGQAPESTCKAWFLFVVIIAMFSKMQIELMFIMRVYALFNRRRWVLLLCVLGAIDPTFNLGFTVHMMPRMGFDDACILVRFSRAYLPGLCLSVTVHTILAGITLMRSFLAVRAGWGRTPLLSLLIREGLASYIAFAALAIITLAMCLREGMQVISLTLWATAILSTCGCRFIINMQRLARKHNLGRRSRPDSNVMFTSLIEMTEL